MKSKGTLLTATVMLTLGLVAWQASVTAPAIASDAQSATAASLAVVVTPAVGGDAEYVGDSKCKKCHMKQHRSWKKTGKYKTFESLLPGKAAEAKTKHGLDPAKDYSKDDACLKCHVTGLAAAGGYAVHDGSDEKLAKKMKKLANVGCEMCHGPGSNYIALHEEIQKSKRTYTSEEMYAAGMTKIEESTCTKCHNSDSPTFEAFNYAEMKDNTAGLHEHFDLKQRTD